jgi:hypothetical protein
MKDKIKVDIVTFAKHRDYLGFHLFSYEEVQLKNYEESMNWASYYEWVKPPEKHQRTYQIWKQYQEYLNK